MKRTIVAAAGVIVTLAVAATVVFVLHRGPAASTARSIPAGAQSAVRLLVSAHGRQALTPELNALLPTGRLFPAGTAFTLRPGSWHQAGVYANVSGVLRVPGRSPTQDEIGFVHREGHWLVTFEAHQ